MAANDKPGLGSLSAILRRRPAWIFLVLIATLATVSAVCCLDLVKPDEATVFLLDGRTFKTEQLQAICRAFEKKGLIGYGIDKDRIRVNAAEQGRYLATLAEGNLFPGTPHTSLDQALSQAPFWSSRSQQERTWQLAKQKSIALMIEQMPQIRQASVLLDQSSPSGLQQKADVRGTVTVLPEPGTSLPENWEVTVKSIVSGAVSGMSPDQVNVVNIGSEPPLPVDDPWVDQNEHYQHKIRQALDISGVEVQVQFARTLIPVSHREVAVGGDESGRPAATVNQPMALPEQSEISDQGNQIQTVRVTLRLPAHWRTPSGTTLKLWRGDVEKRVRDQLPGNSDLSLVIAGLPTSPRPPLLDTPDWDWPAAIQPQSTTLLTAAVVVFLLLVLFLLNVRRRYRGDRPPPPARRIRIAAAESGKGSDRKLVRIEPKQAPNPPRSIGRIDWRRFEQLDSLSTREFQVVVDAIDTEVWAEALRGASRQLIKRVLDQLPPEQSNQMRRNIGRRGPFRLADVEAAQQEILETVRRLDRSGDLFPEEREEVYRGIY